MPNASFTTDLPPETDDSVEERQIHHIADESIAALGRTFDHWMKIACGADLGRKRAMREAQTDDPTNHLYQKAYSRWLTRHPHYNTDPVNATCRKWLFRCYDNLGDIINWRRGRGPAEMMRYNYPQQVFMRWAEEMRPDLYERYKRQPRPSAASRAVPVIVQATLDLEQVVGEAVDVITNPRGQDLSVEDAPGFARSFLRAIEGRPPEVLLAYIQPLIEALPSAMRPSPVITGIDLSNERTVKESAARFYENYRAQYDTARIYAFGGALQMFINRNGGVPGAVGIPVGVQRPIARPTRSRNDPPQV